jgi:hypothetical protein
MTPFWVEPQGVCVEADSETSARQIAKALTRQEPTSVDVLPYPAEPRVGDHSDCPSFCFTPKACAGHSSCPRSYACSE